MTTPAGQAPERVPVGRVGKAHGLDGSFYVAEAMPELLAKGAEVFVAGEIEPRTIERRAGTDARPILRLSGSANRNDADALRGLALSVAAGDAPALDDNEYWAHQLVGCQVLGRPEAGSPERLGEVAELMALPSCEALVVRGGPRGEVLVPMVRDAILQIAPDDRLIVVDLAFLALDG